MFLKYLSTALVCIATIHSSYGQTWLEPWPSPRMLTLLQVPRSEEQLVRAGRL
jgi:hypothetical protein